MRAKTIIVLLGLCFVFAVLAACGDVSTGVNYLMTGNTSSPSSGSGSLSFSLFGEQSSASHGGSDYRSMARQDAQDAGIPANLYIRQINQESGWNPNAVSSAGAIGIAQIMPDTANSWGVDPHDPVASLKVAADHMHWYYQHYGNDYAKALAAYNAGTGSVDSAEARCGYGWQGCVPSETQGYINAIMG